MKKLLGYAWKLKSESAEKVLDEYYNNDITMLEKNKKETLKDIKFAKELGNIKKQAKTQIIAIYAEIKE